MLGETGLLIGGWGTEKLRDLLKLKAKLGRANGPFPHPLSSASVNACMQEAFWPLIFFVLFFFFLELDNDKGLKLEHSRELAVSRNQDCSVLWSKACWATLNFHNTASIS